MVDTQKHVISILLIDNKMLGKNTNSSIIIIIIVIKIIITLSGKSKQQLKLHMAIT